MLAGERLKEAFGTKNPPKQIRQIVEQSAETYQKYQRRNIEEKTHTEQNITEEDQKNKTEQDITDQSAATKETNRRPTKVKA